MEELEGLIEDLKSGEDVRAEAAIRKIAAFGNRAVPPLKKLLHSSESDTRWWATYAISEVKDPKTTPILCSMLKDPDLSVRQCAALALRQQPSKDAIPDLVAALQSDDKTLTHLAAAALVAIGPEAVQPLIGLLDNGSANARLLGIRALALIADQKSIPALIDALKNDSALMEYWASEGLDRMGVGMSFFQT